MKGKNGFLPATDKEWVEELSLLARDVALRRRLGQKGREALEEHYSLKLWGPESSKSLSTLI